MTTCANGRSDVSVVLRPGTKPQNIEPTSKEQLQLKFKRGNKRVVAQWINTCRNIKTPHASKLLCTLAGAASESARSRHLPTFSLGPTRTCVIIVWRKLVSLALSSLGVSHATLEFTILILILYPHHHPHLVPTTSQSHHCCQFTDTPVMVTV